MSKFSLTNLFGMTIRESANDGSDFTNPDADYRRLFLGEDGLLHVKDSAGTVTSPYSSGSGTNLNPGTSFPGSPATNDLCFRTDRGLLYFYDGTRWLTLNLYAWTMDAGAFISAGVTVSGTAIGRFTPWHTTYDLYCVDLWASLYVSTTNTGSAYWTITLMRYQSNLSTTSSLSSVNTSANSPNVVVTSQTSINALFTPATYKLMQVEATKTGSPGTLQAPPIMLTYRLVG